MQKANEINKSYGFHLGILISLIIFGCINQRYEEKSIQFGGKKRTYLIEQPLLNSISKRLPLIIILHGHFESGNFLAWKDKIGCDSISEVTTIQSCATMKRWKNRNDDETVLWITDNGGHAWPGGKGFLFLSHFEPSKCVNANQMIFDFFQKHKLKRTGGL